MNKTLTLLLGGYFTGKKIFRKILRESNPAAISLSTGVFRSDMADFDSFSNIRHPEKLPTLVGEYFNILTLKSFNAIEKGSDLIISEHGEDFEVLSKVILKAKENGYKVITWGFFLGKEDIQEKIESSKSFRGRTPLASMAFSIAEGFRKNFSRYVELSDSSTLVYSGAFPKIVWEGGKVCAPEYTLFETVLFDGILSDAQVWREYSLASSAQQNDSSSSRYMEGEEYAERTEMFRRLK